MLNDNNHLELRFLFRTEALAEDFSAQKDRPELTKLYNVLADYGAEVHCMARLFDSDENESSLHRTFREVLEKNPHASEFKKEVCVLLPHDGNLKTLWRNLAAAPALESIIQQDSVKIEIGGHTNFLGWVKGEDFIPAERPEFEPPPHKPRKKGVHFL